MLYNLFAIIYLLGPFVGLCFVFRKAGLAAWKALVPIYNIVLWIKLCGKDWRWYIYFLIPGINIFTFLLLVVETAKVFGRNSLLEQTVAVLVPFAYLPYLGLSKHKYHAPTAPAKKDPLAETKKVKKTARQSAREWAEAIIFAVVAAVIIRGTIFELYNIPSSSMEKSMMVGDYVMVSKVAYGPRVPMTPLSFPLVHNVLPLTNNQVESYLKWIKLPYHRYPGTKGVKRFDATVFNYPDGDTVCSAFQSNRSYHDLVREYGRDVVCSNKAVFGKIVVRPVDKRENFIKRCIGLPGETLQIVDRQVLINGKPIENPQDLQFTYAVRMKESYSQYAENMSRIGAYSNDIFVAKMQKDCMVFSSLGVSREDCETAFGLYSYLYLSPNQIEKAQQYSDKLKMEPLTTMRDSCRLVRFVPQYDLVYPYESERAAAQAYQQLTSSLAEAGMSNSDIAMAGEYYTLPLTEEMVRSLSAHPDVAEVIPITTIEGYSGLDLFPHAAGYQWSVDNFGPLTIPSKGSTVQLTEQNLPLYRRIIEIFEHNTLEQRDGKIIINGQASTSYTFKMDYYWMMGDNRHNSADSRYWGFVPENHIVGRASMVVFSRDQDQRKTRWNRIFKRKL